MFADLCPGSFPGSPPLPLRRGRPHPHSDKQGICLHSFSPMVASICWKINNLHIDLIFSTFPTIQIIQYKFFHHFSCSFPGNTPKTPVFSHLFPLFSGKIQPESPRFSPGFSPTSPLFCTNLCGILSHTTCRGLSLSRKSCLFSPENSKKAQRTPKHSLGFGERCLITQTRGRSA